MIFLQGKTLLIISPVKVNIMNVHFGPEKVLLSCHVLVLNDLKKF